VNFVSTLRRRSPLPLLIVAVGLTAIAAIDAHRATVAQQETVARAMTQFGSFGVWSYTRRLEDRITAMLSEALGAVNHGDHVHMRPPVPSARDLAHYLPFDSRCECHHTRFGPNPRNLFAFRLGERELDVAINTHPNPVEGWEVDRAPLMRIVAPYSDEERRWIVDTLTRDIRAVPRPHRGFSLVMTRRVLAYTLMPTAWGDTMVYGGEYERSDVSDLLTDLLDERALLPAAFITGHPNRDIIVARVWQRDGVKLLDSDSTESPTHASTVALEPKYGAISVEMFVRPQQGELVVFGDLPRSHLPFLLGLLAVAAALAVVAVFQLRREQELARMRSDFVSNVSHELRTPLAQIRLYSETLRFGRTRTDEERDWSLRHIERETGRLNHLVDNILRFSRVGAADPARVAPVDVATEVAAVVAEFQPLAASRRVTVDMQLGAGLSADLREDSIRRVLLNLLDNAVKYGPEGQRVLVTLDDAGGEVHVAVNDQGPGVAASERESVWLPFQRGRAARNAAGSGIGLSVVRDIARQHGGRAWVERSPEGGARFVVAFPTVKSEHPRA